MTVDEYLEAAPEPQRATLSELRTMLASILPEAEEGISYGVPALRVEGKTVAGFAFAKTHCSYLPHSGSVINRVDAELLSGYEWSKGTLRFPVDQTPDKALVQRLVELRLDELAG